MGIKMIKLICFDLDGVINDNWDLLPELKLKMTKLKIYGVKMAIVTGRDPLPLETVLKRLAGEMKARRK